MRHTYIYMSVIVVAASTDTHLLALCWALSASCCTFLLFFDFHNWLAMWLEKVKYHNTPSHRTIRV